MNHIYRLFSPPSLLLVAVLMLTLGQETLAQTDTTQKVVSWEFGSKKGTDGKPVLTLHAHILEGWKLYSTTMPDSLPNSRVALDSGAPARILGIEEKGDVHNAKEPLFNNAETRFFTGDAEWTVRVQSGASSGDLRGKITYI